MTGVGSFFSALGVPGFSFTVSTGPSHGGLEFNGENVTYTPAPHYNGSDSFEVLVCAGSGVCELHIVTLEIASVPDAPWLVDPDTIGEDVPAALDEIEISLTVGKGLPDLTVFNPDATPYEVRLAGGELPAGVALNADGSFTGVTTTTGIYEATLEICNTEAALCTTTTLSVTVLAGTENLANTGPSTEGWEIIALTLAGVGMMLLFLGRTPRRRHQS